MTFLQVHSADNVLVALSDLAAGNEVAFGGSIIALPKAVRAKHKFVTQPLAPGDGVIMYGVLVGRAVTAIAIGEPVTTSNVKHASQSFGKRNNTAQWSPPDISTFEGQTFSGYHRKDGQVGTANHWLVLPLVFCENRNVGALREAFEKGLGYAEPSPYQQQVVELAKRFREGAGTEELRDVGQRDGKPAVPGHRVFQNVDGIRFLTHEGGCGGTRADARTLCGLLAGYLKNPNVVGATVLSLGCQHAQVSLLQEELAKRDADFGKPLLVFEQQKFSSEFEMLSDAIRDTFAGLTEANKVERKPAPLSKLTVGVECGGSDGFSGISANPAIGYASDLLVALGGTVILSEFPELCGIEQELIDRCTTDAVADRFAHLMRAYQAAAEAVGSGFDMNPSPGNIRDGLITDAMKSAGAAKKGGTSPVVAVLDYPEYATIAGLNLLCTPGNDVESTTGLAGAGANVILFSTGLGTPTGNPITPVVKVSTNSDVASRMSDLIDFDCGPIITGAQTIQESGEALLELVVRVASGTVQTRAEGLAQFDFIPWKRGVSL